MIRTQDAIEGIATRIEKAYRRKNPGWGPIGLTSGVWTAAAARLLEANDSFPSIQPDPELFVAVQSRSRLAPDPWSELTQLSSLDRYLKALRRIIKQLREELRAEVRRAECYVVRGQSLDVVLEAQGSRISPLGCFIVAYRAGRQDLSGKYRVAAEGQHRSCPLYMLASRSLLPANAYPSKDLETNRSSLGREFVTFSLN